MVTLGLAVGYIHLLGHLFNFKTPLNFKLHFNFNKIERNNVQLVNVKQLSFDSFSKVTLKYIATMLLERNSSGSKLVTFKRN